MTTSNSRLTQIKPILDIIDKHIKFNDGYDLSEINTLKRIKTEIEALPSFDDILDIERNYEGVREYYGLYDLNDIFLKLIEHYVIDGRINPLDYVRIAEIYSQCKDYVKSISQTA